MISETFELSGRAVTVRGEENADFLLIQPMGDFEIKSAETEYEHMKKSGRYLFVAFEVKNWNDELSPWRAAHVWGNEPFGGKAEETLSFAINELLPSLKEKYRLDDSIKAVIGGYSLAALFSLWAVYKTDAFYAAAAASPSVWFPEWTDFITNNHPKAKKIYLSLGKKEEKTKNKAMAAVGDNIRKMYDIIQSTTDTVLEWNEGGHFNSPDIRTARAFEWSAK